MRGWNDEYVYLRTGKQKAKPTASIARNQSVRESTKRVESDCFWWREKMVEGKKKQGFCLPNLVGLNLETMYTMTDSCWCMAETNTIL